MYKNIYNTVYVLVFYKYSLIAIEHVKSSVLSRYSPFLVFRSVGRFITDGSRRHIGSIFKDPDVKVLFIRDSKL
jgi:hypothetical protein